MKPHAFIFIGRSGCGKGTQVELLKPLLEEKTSLPVFYVETGDMFRNFIKGESYSEKLSNEIYKKDGRQPDFLACYMWSQAVLNNYAGGAHIIFDGVSRSVTEAKLLETLFTFYGFEKVHVIYLDVSRKWSEDRLLARGRPDDATIAKIDTRLNWFDKDVVPAIEYFKTSGHDFIRIDGEKSIEEVHTNIKSSLAPLI
jgi:adenylate kinase family enzyme